MKQFIGIALFWGVIVQACGQPTPAVPSWESTSCDSARIVQSMSMYDLLSPVYRTDSLREQTIGISRVLAFMNDGTGKLVFMGSHRTGSPVDSLPAATTSLDSMQMHSYLSSITENPVFLYNRWSWLLDTTRREFLARRDSLVDSLQQQLSAFNVKVISDLRSADLQTRLVGRGRSMAPISFHQLGLAADLGFFRRGRLVRNAGPYDRIGDLTPYYKLVWGGNFVGFVDPPHFQLYTNAAEFLREFPLLRYEFEPFFEHYMNRYREKVAANRESEVQDTKALVMTLVEFRHLMPCVCALSTAEYTPSVPKTIRIGESDLLILADLPSQQLAVWRGDRLLVKYRLGIWH